MKKVILGFAMIVATQSPAFASNYDRSITASLVATPAVSIAAGATASFAGAPAASAVALVGGAAVAGITGFAFHMDDKSRRSRRLRIDDESVVRGRPNN